MAWMSSQAPKKFPGGWERALPPVRPRWPAEKKYAVMVVALNVLSLLLMWVPYVGLLFMGPILAGMWVGEAVFGSRGLWPLGTVAKVVIFVLVVVFYYAMLMLPWLLRAHSSGRWRMFWTAVFVLFLAVLVLLPWAWLRYFFGPAMKDF